MKSRFGFGKRILALTLCAMMGLAAVPAFEPQQVYAAAGTMSDVSATHWARGSLQNMVNLGVISGDRTGKIHPDRAVTRAEYVAMLNRAFNYNSFQNTEIPFTDISGREWYADHIRAAYAQGYFSGISPTLAGANRSVTREEAAALLCRNLKVDKKTLQLYDFTDGTRISQWSRNVIGAAVDKGYLHGYSDGSFRPKNNISRAEAAVMLSNALGTIVSTRGTYTYGMIGGNMTISDSDVTLQDTTITGDLYITEGVGTGFVNLKNVQVLGEVIVAGGGEGNFGGNSVVLDDCTIQKLTVDGPEDRPLSLYAKGNTKIANTNIKSTAFLENNERTSPGFDNIQVMGPEDTKLHLAGGRFENVLIINPKNQVQLGRGTVGNLTVDEDAADSQITLDRKTLVENLRTDGACQVSGRGDIKNLMITTDGVKVAQLPDRIEIRPGVTADVGGQKMNSLDAEESSARPRILAGYPRADETTPVATNMLFAANKPGSIYWVLTYGDADEPTQEEIIKPTTINRIKKNGSMSVAESEEELKMALSGLESNTDYNLSALLVDSRGDFSTIKTETFRTADNTKPGFVSGYPRIVPQDSHSFRIEAMPTKNGTIYWAAFKKGAVAPTAYQLRSQKLNGDIDHGKYAKAKRNVEAIMSTKKELTEKEVYDVYIMASDGENDSAIVKLAGTTKDTTPPEFTRGTPIPDKSTDTSVDVKVSSNEDATVYYVVTEWGDTFPIPVPPSPDPPKLDSEEAKNQVVAANSAFKAGKATLKQDKEAIVKISGKPLEAETPYHLYMVLQDKAGNLSEVKKVDIKTRDVIPPTAKVEFDDPIDGKARVENEIRIVFSEIVWGSTKLAEMTPEDITADFLTLDDVTTGKAEPVEIDYKKIKIDKGENGETVWVFPPEAFPENGGLNSGSRYQFQVKNIVDTSSNPMKKPKNEVKLDIFETIPPLIELTETPTPSEYDYTFSLKPQSKKTSDLVLFDMIFQSNTHIRFELYVRNDPMGTFERVGDDAYTPLIWENGATTLYYIIDKGIDSEKEYTFEKFSALDDYREYAVKITEIDGDSQRNGWNRIVNIDVKCVAGPYRQLSTLAADPIKHYDEVIGGGLASNVNYSTQNINKPTEFKMEIPFTDTLRPKFIEDEGYPILEDRPGAKPEDAMITDILIRPQLKTNRNAMMYYVIAPKGVIGVEREDPNDPDSPPKQSALDKMALSIIANAYKNDGIFWGRYNIESGNVIYQPTLPEKGGLTPETDYEAFFVLKSTPPEPSQVYYKEFTTTPIAPPTLDATVLSRGENSAQIQIEANKTSKVDWIILTTSDAANILAKDATTGKWIVPAGREEGIKTIIRNGLQNTVVSPHSYGSGTAKFVNGQNIYELMVDATNLQRETYYVLLAVAKMQLSTGGTVGGDSVIAISEEFTSKDVTPPQIRVPDGTDELPTSIDQVAAADLEFKKDETYSGIVTLNFTEPLFYMDYEGAPPEPLTKDVFTAKFLDALGENFGLYKLNMQTIPNEDGTAGKSAVIGCQLTFKKARTNRTASVFMNLCDAEGNMMKPFTLYFQEEDNWGLSDQERIALRMTSYWYFTYDNIT